MERGVAELTDNGEWGELLTQNHTADGGPAPRGRTPPRPFPMMSYCAARHSIPGQSWQAGGWADGRTAGRHGRNEAPRAQTSTDSTDLTCPTTSLSCAARPHPHSCAGGNRQAHEDAPHTQGRNQTTEQGFLQTQEIETVRDLWKGEQNDN